MSEHKPERKGDSPLTQVIVSMSGASASNHDSEPPGASSNSVKAGHEPDQFEAKGILYVPLFVVVTVLTSFAIVTVIFFSIYGKNPGDPVANPIASKNSNSSINDRFAAISSSDPNAEVKQPRLEYLKQVEDAKNDPPYLRSKRPVNAVGGTYEIRPEDLRPENYIDPITKRKILMDTRWVDDGKKTTAIIPIEQAMNLVIQKKMLPIRANPILVASTNDAKAKPSNAGRGGPSQPIAVTPKLDDVKPDDKKAGH